ncbi:PQQ-dependent sugar dehydrogenase [Paracoccus marinaquae]|nr:PQQ-dependent sugar dehydrogenase [Paracoccus marinaquae]
MAQDFNESPPNGQDQTPAFDGQTRAPVLPARDLRRQVVVGGLEYPWGMAELPDGSWLVTERPGRLRMVSPDGKLSEPIEGLPPVDDRGQGGLLDVIVDEDFAQTRRLWVAFSEIHQYELSGTSVATGILSEDGRRIDGLQVLWGQEPWNSNIHLGARLVLDNDGGLFVTTGERGEIERPPATQDVGSTIGKVVRVDPLTGDPMGATGIEGAIPELWSYGHRNVQGAALGPDGALWTIEHGPRGGDELNRPEAGKNYGWPLVTYGTNYDGTPVGDGLTQMEGIEQPVYYWDPIVAPSGMIFYDGEMFPDWQGDLLFGGLSTQSLVQLKIADGRVIGEARHLWGEEGRIRDVDVARDGAIMLLIDAEDGAMIRVTPAD